MRRHICTEEIYFKPLRKTRFYVVFYGRTNRGPPSRKLLYSTGSAGRQDLNPERHFNTPTQLIAILMLSDLTSTSKQPLATE